MSRNGMRPQSTEFEHRTSTTASGDEADSLEISVLCLLFVVSVIGVGMLAALVV